MQYGIQRIRYCANRKLETATLSALTHSLKHKISIIQNPLILDFAQGHLKGNQK